MYLHLHCVKQQLSLITENFNKYDVSNNVPSHSNVKQETQMLQKCTVLHVTWTLYSVSDSSVNSSLCMTPILSKTEHLMLSATCDGCNDSFFSVV